MMDPRNPFPRDYAILGSFLKDLLSLITPDEDDQIRRADVISDIATSLTCLQSLKGSSVQPFGSYVSKLYSRWGDLDISIELAVSDVSKSKKLNVLKQLRDVLQRTGVAHYIQFIPQARVPLLIFESNRHHISCDVSVGNCEGLLKSKFLLWISHIDGRFHDIVLLVKEWAKAHKINDPKNGSLNSYALCLMVIFHLQTCSPSILPPLRDIYGGNMVEDLKGVGSAYKRDIEHSCNEKIDRLRAQGFNQANKSSLAELFVSFFEKFTDIGTRSSQQAICTFTGRWENLYSKRDWTKKSYPLVIEDPFEQPTNCARSVRAFDLLRISDAFNNTRGDLRSPFRKICSSRTSLAKLLIRPETATLMGLGAPERRADDMHNEFERLLNLNSRQPQVHAGYASRMEPSSSTVHLQQRPSSTLHLHRGPSNLHSQRAPSPIVHLQRASSSNLHLQRDASWNVNSPRQSSSTVPGERRGPLVSHLQGHGSYDTLTANRPYSSTPRSNNGYYQSASQRGGPKQRLPKYHS
ncbi:hypothetical protein AMTRI_Chr08g203260 [Amborella trichopoda]